MKEIVTTAYKSADGRTFRTKDACADHEAKWLAFDAIVRQKIGEYQLRELLIGRGVATVDSLPFEAPWFSPFGACLINISDLRRNEAGKVEFQLADEKGIPYDGGTAWVMADAFYDEWPQ